MTGTKDKFLWLNYDPQWLVGLAQREYPNNIELAKALSLCTRAQRRSTDLDGYYSTKFIDSTNPNQPGSRWQFDKTITLESWPEGTIRLDIMKDGSVGAMEMSVSPALTEFDEQVANQLQRLSIRLVKDENKDE